MKVKQSKAFSVANGTFRLLAKCYVYLKKPKVIAVAGSVGKTSTKLFVSKILSSEREASYMDDSYNSGIGLYLSVFRLKVPTQFRNIFAWLVLMLKALAQFFIKGPEILVIEYGIDHIGEMDEFVQFLKPDIAIITAISPEHMEFLHDIDTVAKEELKLIPAVKQFSIINSADIDPKYTKDLMGKVYDYGLPGADSTYKINKWTTSGATVSFTANETILKDISIKLVSEPLIRQLAGAILLADLMGISKRSIIKAVEELEPAASRMMLLKGVNDSVVVDDTTNFSPFAGIESLKSLKNIPAKRHVAVLGNMHELGKYADEGFKDVSEHFKNGIDVLVLVGELSIEKFSPYAIKFGYVENKNLFYFKDAISAGVYIRDNLVQEGDAILVKGPFGGYYLEETVKKLLKNQSDAKKLTRQSDFWINTKRKLFGSSFESE